jgi:hypothetical protein
MNSYPILRQGNDWDYLMPDYVTQLDGRLWNVKSCKTLQSCRDKLESSLSPDLEKARDFFSGKVLGSKTERDRLNITTIPLEIDNSGECMWWIYESFKTCVKGNVQFRPNNAYMMVAYEGYVEMIAWEYLELKGFEGLDIIEQLIFHFSKWKKLDYTAFNDLEREVPRIEMSLF